MGVETLLSDEELCQARSVAGTLNLNLEVLGSTEGYTLVRLDPLLVDAINWVDESSR